MELDPNYAEVWNNLGSVFVQLRRAAEAIAAWRTAVRLVPDYADAHFNLANVMRATGLLREAETHAEQFRRRSSANRLLTERGSWLRVVSADD